MGDCVLNFTTGNQGETMINSPVKAMVCSNHAFIILNQAVVGEKIFCKSNGLYKSTFQNYSNNNIYCPLFRAEIICI